jgi:hypothetical protein
MQMSETFEQALAAVADMENEPKYKIGQPLWPRDSTDCRALIVIGIHKPMFGAWRYDVVLETDPTGPIYLGLEDYFTAELPATPTLHTAQKGNVYFTRNGVALKCIRHPLDQGRAP